VRKKSENGRFLHLKSEIRNLKLDCQKPALSWVQFTILDFGFEMQELSNFKILPHLLGTVLFLLACLPASAQVTPSTPTQVTWTFLGPTGSADRITALAADPRSDSVLYAGTPGGGIWKTQDAGVTWVPLFDSQPSLQVCSLAIDRLNPDVIFAGTGDDQNPRQAQGVARSSDAGRTWTAAARFTDRPVCALGIDPTNSARVFAGSAEGLFISSDGGFSWTKTLSTPITSIAFDGPGIVYVGMINSNSPGSRDHIFSRSSDGGRTWTDLSLPRSPSAPSADTNWVTILTNGIDVFVAVSYPATPLSQVDFFSSSNGGNQWSGTFGIAQALPPMSLVADLSGTLYLAASNLLTSVNRGAGWTAAATKTSNFHTAAFLGNALILAGERGFDSYSLGRDITPIPVAQIFGAGIENTGQVWAGGPTGLFGLFPSSTTTKTGVTGIGAVGRVSVVSVGATPDIFAAGPNRVYQSTNGGGQFSSETVIAADELRAPYPPVVVDPVISATAYVAGRRIYRTTNSGVDWTAFNIIDEDPTRVVIALALAPTARSTLFAATACIPEVALTTCPPLSVIWRSTNAGQTWVQMSVVSGYVNRFAIDPRQSTRVYAAVGGFPAGPSASAGLIAGDLLASATAGTTGSWTSLLGNLPRTSINTVTIDPTSLPAQFTLPAQTLYAGTDAGVFVSFDAGTRWMNISNGLPASPITDLALLQPDGILVASTFGRGVYSGTVKGITGGLVVQPLSQEVTLMQGTTEHIGVALINTSSSATVDWQLTALDTWLVPLTSGTIRPSATSQIPISVSAADLRNGTYVGRLQLSSPFGVQDITIEAHVILAPAHLNIVGSTKLSGLTGSALPPLQVLVTDENQSPLAGIPVTFSIASGSGSLSARTDLTNDSGIASVVLTLPAQASTVQVVATSGSLSVTFTAVTIEPPSLLTDSVFDAVTFNPSASFGPGSILAIGGRNLASSDVVAADTLPLSLGTTRVLLTTAGGDVPLPLFSVSAALITALLPYDIASGRYMLHCEVGSVRSNDVEISVAAFAPGIFTGTGNGRGPGIFLKDDGSMVTASNPADRGSRVTFYASGLGAVNPQVEAGQPGAVAEPLNRTLQTPRVFFDRFSANVTFSGLARGIAGRYQVAVQVPLTVSPASNVSVSMTIGGYTSNRVTIPVR